MAHEHQHLTDARIKIGASVLVDAREAYWGITQEVVGDIVNGLYAAYHRPLNIKKCALLLNDLTYPLARAYEQSADKYGIRVIACSFLDGACVWLGLDTKSGRVTLGEDQESPHCFPARHLVTERSP